MPPAGRPLDLVFMGTPDFAATVLAGLIAAGHRIAAVYTQPPRPAGRGHRLIASPVQVLAEREGVTVRCPKTLRDPATQAEFAAVGADLAVVVAYGLILPAPILRSPRLGCINVHASLLPRWRGAAPIQRAILAGDQETGITIMLMDEGLDTGPILLHRPIAIGSTTTAGELTGQLADLGSDLVIEAIDEMLQGGLMPRPQPENGAVYAAKLKREEAWLDWRRPANVLERQVRAFDPWPGAFFDGRGERIRVLTSAADMQTTPTAAPGTVLDAELSIACTQGVFRPLRVQRAGRAALDVEAFLRGFALPAGMVLPCPATN